MPLSSLIGTSRAASRSGLSLTPTIEEFKGSAALDAGLISAAQAGEHYEISRYGTLIA
ncbi:ferritin-like metal-binding protein YciE [Rhizobium mongolense]|uniref:Ferritin-like metal-binding protein YciE n=1 Tax=Rhizobium mongolense TaxID=57676 RepID=A0ABR6IHK5_9HYPH|nr:ferritin-like metal-binding protein YciE [Rhizobium mongolense]